MTKKIHKRKVLKGWVRATIFIILCIICLFAIFLICYGFSNHKNLDDYLFKYDIKNDADYKIYLNDNAMREEEYIGMNQLVPTDNIDHIDIRYNYNFKGSEESKINYSYNIVGRLVIEYDNINYGKQILDFKDYVLKEQKEGSFESTSGFSLSDSVEINYSEYDQIVKNYIMEKGINVTGKLEVKMNIKTNGELEGNKDYTSDNVINVSIPLSEKVIMLTKDYKETDFGIIEDENASKKEIQIVPFTIGIITLATSGILLIYLSKTVIFISTKSEYRKQIEKIFKEYSEILVEVSSSVEYEDYTFIDIKEFEDMIDLEEEYKSPILYYERIQGYESWFVIIKDNFMYRYILRAN